MLATAVSPHPVSRHQKPRTLISKVLRPFRANAGKSLSSPDILPTPTPASNPTTTMSDSATQPSSDSPVTKIVNCKILRNHTLVQEDAVWIQDGKILNPEPFFWDMKRVPDRVIDAKGAILAPGFIDIQINGAFGVDFSADVDNLKAGLEKVSRGLLKYGCTAFCPTVVSSDAAVYRQVLPHMHPRPGTSKTGATILGAHVEGPFINPGRIGAHEPVNIRSAPNGYADIAEMYTIEDSGDAIKIVTMAPEVPGVMDAIEELVKRGIIVSVGHTSATVQQAEKAVEKGATLITHLFNAMQEFHHRDPGPLGLLGRPTNPPPPPLYYGIICDGIHSHPHSVRIAHSAHPAGCVLVTDAMAAAGLEPGVYTLGTMVARKVGGAVYIDGTDTLAGSVATIDECIRNYQRYTSCTLVEAIEAATLHPAQALGIAHQKGTLDYGADADLVFLDDELKVLRVFVAGEEVDLEEVGKGL